MDIDDLIKESEIAAEWESEMDMLDYLRRIGEKHVATMSPLEIAMMQEDYDPNEPLPTD